MAERNTTLRRIVAGTDFTRPASAAVMRAAMLAEEHCAKLRIVHVAPRVSDIELRWLGVKVPKVDSSLTAADARLQETVEQARLIHADVSGKMVTGSPPAMLVAEAKRFDADLIVVGHHGERSLRRVVIGTTAERLMERWGRDILVVRRPTKNAYRRVLVCVALAPASGAVVRSALRLSDRADIHVLHAYEPVFEKLLVKHGVDASAIEEHHRVAVAEASGRIDRLLREIAPTGVRRFKTLLRRGDPFDVIERIARRTLPDVVVLGRNESAIEEFFLGGVTKNVVRTISADVLIAGRARN